MNSVIAFKRSESKVDSTVFFFLSDFPSMSCSVYSVSISGYFMVCLNCGLFTVMAAIGVLRCYSCSGVVIYILLSKNVLYWKKR